MAGRTGTLIGTAFALATPALAQEAQRQVPLSDTEDASLDMPSVGRGRLHPVLGLDLRNGDFVRGSYDDDGAGLGRLPVHARLGLVYELGAGGGEPSAWLELHSSNGFHAPDARDAASPRAWYESNNLAGLAVRIAPHAVGALSYTFKTSPNGVSPATHEVSAALSWQGESGIGALQPGLAATWRPKGGGGAYTQATLAPGIGVGPSGGQGRLSLPLALGVGWRSFYGAGSGTRLFGSAGVAYRRPFTIGDARFALRAEASGLIRDAGLRMLDPRGSRRTFRPYTLVALSYAY